MTDTQTYEPTVFEIERPGPASMKRVLIRAVTAAAALAGLGAGWFVLCLLVTYGRHW